jgi:hypothetical protein
MRLIQLKIRRSHRPITLSPHYTSRRMSILFYRFRPIAAMRRAVRRDRSTRHALSLTSSFSRSSVHSSCVSPEIIAGVGVTYRSFRAF